MGARPPEHASAGETVTTRQKETVDNDAEALDSDLEASASGHLLYDLLSDEAAAGTASGETRTTKKIETVDEAPADHHEDFLPA
ncbi:MAG: hypothetical protein ACRDPC_12605 [Solirubrobacteraceae bacterium]